jgi:hypothetical protein
MSVAPAPAPSLKAWWVGLYATHTVLATDRDAARKAWENGEEVETEIDTEGGPRYIEDANLSASEIEALMAKPTQTQPGEALDQITAILSGKEWNAEALDAVADVVRGTGREIKDTDETEA